MGLEALKGEAYTITIQMPRYLAVQGRILPRENSIIHVSGAKNSILLLLPATVLTSGLSTFRNAPTTIRDVQSMINLLRGYGIATQVGSSSITVDTLQKTQPRELPPRSGTRYSILLLGAALAVWRRACVHTPGGCQFRKLRPIDIHLEGLSHFGAKITATGDYITATLEKPTYGRFRMRYPSVGATANLLLFSVLGGGTRILSNCACTPEIIDLVDYLNLCGADIQWQASRQIRITGVSRLGTTTWSVPPDRIEAATYMILAAVLGFDLTIGPAVSEHMQDLFSVFDAMQLPYHVDDATRSIVVHGSRQRLLKPISVESGPFPVLSSDYLPLLSVLSLAAEGRSMLIDSVHAGRFGFADELRKLGASIKVSESHIFVTRSITDLRGTDLVCHDIRGGMACVLASLVAEGESRIYEIEQVERGYDAFVAKLQALGLRLQLREIA